MEEAWPPVRGLRKLEVPAIAPEDERWEVLLGEEDLQLRGNLVYQEIQPR